MWIRALCSRLRNHRGFNIYLNSERLRLGKTHYFFGIFLLFYTVFLCLATQEFLQKWCCLDLFTRLRPRESCLNRSGFWKHFQANAIVEGLIYLWFEDHMKIGYQEVLYGFWNHYGLLCNLNVYSNFYPTFFVNPKVH